MRWKTFILAGVLACLCVFDAQGAAQAAPNRLLLVCGKRSAIPSLSNVEVRRLFLGAPVEKHGVRIQPLRNVADSRVTEEFLQKIVFMSKRKYELQLVSRVFRQGGAMPKAYKHLPELVDALRQSPAAVSYMSSGQFERTSGLKSIGVLWDGSEQ